MSVKATLSLIILSCFADIFCADGQQVTNYNLVKLLRENKLTIIPGMQTHVLDSTDKPAITTKGIAWIRAITFADGAIDVDLRGKDVFLQSFLGIAFHAKDTSNYEVIYFRPFRFHSTDTPTRKWSVQYAGVPGNDWETLRKAHPGVYENQVNPVPAATDWFHVTVVVKGELITVYVNGSKTPSLQVKSLISARTGAIGLWADGLTEDFANLTITTPE